MRNIYFLAVLLFLSAWAYAPNPLAYVSDPSQLVVVVPNRLSTSGMAGLSFGPPQLLDYSVDSLTVTDRTSKFPVTSALIRNNISINQEFFNLGLVGNTEEEIKGRFLNYQFSITGSALSNQLITGNKLGKLCVEYGVAYPRNVSTRYLAKNKECIGVYRNYFSESGYIPVGPRISVFAGIYSSSKGWQKAPGYSQYIDVYYIRVDGQRSNTLKIPMPVWGSFT